MTFRANTYAAVALCLAGSLLAPAAVPAAASAATEIRFEPAREYELPTTFTCGGNASASADFDGDGSADLVVASAPGGPFVLTNRGDGTFGEPVQQQTGLRDACVVGTGDLNGDGKPDIVVASQFELFGGQLENGVQVLLGRGDGTFHALPEIYRIPADAMNVAFADFNRDGHLDVAVVGGPNVDGASLAAFLLRRGEVTILLGRGDGTFDRPQNLGLRGGFPQGIAAGDVNGDGFADLAVGDSFGDQQNLGQPDGHFYVLIGRGDGTFAPKVSYPAGFYAEQVVLGDLDGDDHLDIATNSAGTNSLSLLFNRGDGTFGQTVTMPLGNPQVFPPPLAVANGGAGLQVADFDGDGVPDLAATHALSPGVSILAGVGGGRFEPVGDYRIGATYPEFATVADLTGDALPDVVVPGTVPNGVERPVVSVLLNASEPPPP